jgi:hypothetical protein
MSAKWLRENDPQFVHVSRNQVENRLALRREAVAQQIEGIGFRVETGCNLGEHGSLRV